MIKALTHFLILVSLVLEISCKQKKKDEEQILGTRYSRFDQYVSVVLGSEKKEDKKILVYALEEVNVKEKIIHAEKEYFRLTTVNGKEAYALSKNFSEAVYFVLKTVDAFRKPTLTAGTRGKLETSSICFQKEIQGEWGNVDCLGANSTESKLEDWYDVWIQPNSESFTKNPLLGQTALEIKMVKSILIELNKGTLSPELAEKQKSKAKEILDKSKERADVFLELATELETKLNSY
jgi:lipoprotein LenA